PQPPTQQPLALRTLNDGTITVGCHVKPGAKKSAVLSFDAVMECSLAAPPRDGEANEELLALISEHLECKKHQLSLVSGHKSRDKV
ncbi:YggU-like protein, partial [Gonapodya prolifera JEL478]